MGRTSRGSLCGGGSPTRCSASTPATAQRPLRSSSRSSRHGRGGPHAGGDLDAARSRPRARRGRPPRATEVFREAAAAAAELGAGTLVELAEHELRSLGVRTWASRAASADLAALTEREYEVASLAAAGATNPRSRSSCSSRERRSNDTSRMRSRRSACAIEPSSPRASHRSRRVPYQARVLRSAPTPTL